MDKWILDVCCGSRMFWFDKTHPHTVFMDNRVVHDILCDGRKLDIEPDIVGDFRSIPFGDDAFHMVVFDPPHLARVGENSWMAKKYGKLSETWPEDLKKGFSECMRVLKPNGTLIFKWNEQQVRLSEVLEAIDYKPLFGNRRGGTHWLVFMKEDIMAKKRNCRRTEEEAAIHKRAVELRKMTDEQLVQHVEDMIEKARSEGFERGKKHGNFDPAEFIEGIGNIRGIGEKAMEKIRGYTEEGGWI